MAINQVKYGNTMLIDLTDTTATAEDVKTGKHFYTNAGVRTQGTLSFATIHTGSSAPSSSLGANGDIYLQV